MKKMNLSRAKAIVAAGLLTAGTIMPSASVLAYDTVSTDTTTLTVNGIEAGSTVYAYPIVLDTCDDKGNHEWVYGNGVQDKVRDNEISPVDTYYFYTNLNVGEGSEAHDGNGAAIAKKGTVYLLSGTGTSYSAQVPAGLYVIAAQKEGSNVTYNATVVPVNYTYDANGVAALAKVVTATVKKTDSPELKKEIIENGTASKHNSAKIGDTVNFKISVTIPDYDDSWKTDKLKYVISDTLSEGLTLNQSSITIGGTDIAAPSAEIVPGTGEFVITLTGTDVFNNKGKTLEITYTAVINDKAAVNFDKDTNTATLSYSTGANSTDMSEPVKDETKHYTFGIDTTVNGTGSETTNEVTKKGIHKTENGSESVNLAGAEFQLLDKNKNVLHFTSDGKLDPTDDPADDTDYLDHVTSGADGSLKIEGLDEGTYTLKESKAPQGYALSNTEYTVTIAATYDETTGELKSYTVTIGDGKTAANFTHEKNVSGVIVPSQSDTFAINNTTMAELPSTGGAGVIVVTLAGAAMMGGFGAIFLSLKKKRN